MTAGRRRVAILGGGMAGLSAAWRLSEPGWRDDLESITVYQRGWRLGGKGASSRGANGRIEEHGLHIWLGYYENAFRLLRECYEELDRPRSAPGVPIATWRDALIPAPVVGLFERHGDRWAPWVGEFAANDEAPGEPGGSGGPMTVAGFVARAVRLLGDFVASLAPEGAVTLSTHPVAPPPRPWSLAGSDDAATRRTWHLASVVLATLRGIVADGLLTDPRGSGRSTTRTTGRGSSATAPRPRPPTRRSCAGSTTSCSPTGTATRRWPRSAPAGGLPVGQDVLRLQGLDLLEDDGRDGRRRLRSAVPGLAPARRRVLLPPPRRSAARGRRPADDLRRDGRRAGGPGARRRALRAPRRGQAPAVLPIGPVARPAQRAGRRRPADVRIARRAACRRRRQGPARRRGLRCAGVRHPRRDGEVRVPRADRRPAGLAPAGRARAHRGRPRRSSSGCARTSRRSAGRVRG